MPRSKNYPAHSREGWLARIFHESSTATADMGFYPGVLAPHILRRTVHVRLGFKSLRLPGGKPIFKVSLRQFMKYAGLRNSPEILLDIKQKVWHGVEKLPAGKVGCRGIRMTGRKSRTVKPSLAIFANESHAFKRVRLYRAVREYRGYPDRLQ